MPVKRIETDTEILATRDVMLQLRPHIAPDDYLPTVRRMMDEIDYRVAAAFDADGVVRSVAGYRIFEMLFCRKLMSIDDLVTDERTRSAGHGKELLDWLKGEARVRGCVQIHLDSNVQRESAHRFYFRERFGVRGFHFITDLA
jgi:GNAT superfamily N-acetyltransferase